MKNIIIALFSISLLTSCIAYNSEHNDITLKELNYGPCQTTKTGQTEMDNSLTGIHSYEKNLDFIEQTDSIKAILNAEFSVEYILQSTRNKYVSLEITWKLPKGTKDLDGNILEEISYTKKQYTNTRSWSSYTLSQPNEVQKGTWTLILNVGNKKLLQRNFYLY